MPPEPDSPAYLEACARLGTEIAPWLPRHKLHALGDLALRLEHYPLTPLQEPIWSAQSLGVDDRLYVRHTGAVTLTLQGAWHFLNAARERCCALWGRKYRVEPHTRLIIRRR